MIALLISEALFIDTLTLMSIRAAELAREEAKADQAVVEIFERMKQDVDLYIHKECGRKEAE